MTEIVIRISHNDKSDKLEIALLPRDENPTLVEKDVFLGLMPHVQSLLGQLLKQEGFRDNKKEKEENPLVDQMGAPLSEDYMISNGMIEPEGGAEVIDPKTGDRK
jgi:hypothetical protein